MVLLRNRAACKEAQQQRILLACGRVLLQFVLPHAPKIDRTIPVHNGLHCAGKPRPFVGFKRGVVSRGTDHGGEIAARRVEVVAHPAIADQELQQLFFS